MVKRIILFDGVCNFCNWNVQFIIRRDPKAKFLFAPLQSDVGQTVLQKHHIPKTNDSIVLIEGDHYYVQSTAVLKIARQLHRLYPLLYIFIIIPRPIRHALYRFIAKHRYTWFGKKDRCMIPSKKNKNRFLT